MRGMSLGEIAELLRLELQGDSTLVVSNVAPLDRAQKGELTFLNDRRRLQELQKSDAGAVLLSHQLSHHYTGNKLISDNPHADFARITRLLFPPRESSQTIHPTAVVSASAELGEGVEIGANTVIGDRVVVGEKSIVGPGCVIEEDARLGNECRLHPNVTIAHSVRIGSRVEIHSGATIGADGFGLAIDGDQWIKVPQIGSVWIGDDVEIGANTTIDRGAMIDTVLERGVKLDNLIQIAHNVRIGANTAIAACVGIAGSASIGERCTIGGAAVVLGHLEIVDDVHITAMSLVTKSIDEPGTYSSGTPLEKNNLWHRNFVRFKQLDEMAKRIAVLEKKLRYNDPS